MDQPRNPRDLCCGGIILTGTRQIAERGSVKPFQQSYALMPRIEFRRTAPIKRVQQVKAAPFVLRIAVFVELQRCDSGLYRRLRFRFRLPRLADAPRKRRSSRWKVS